MSRGSCAAGLASLAIVSLSELMNERPWLLSIFFFAITLDLVLDLRAGRNRRDLWLLPALFVLWANTHIQFVYGLFLLFLACAAPLVDRLPWFAADQGPAARAGTPQWRQLAAVATACLLATFVNPYHERLYGVVLAYARSTGLNNVIIEFLPLSFRNPADWTLLVLTLLAAFHLGKRGRFSSFDAGLLAASAYLSFHSRRDAWFMTLSTLAILTNQAAAHASLPPVRSKFTRPQLVGLATCVGAVLIVLGWRCNVTRLGLKHAEALDYPVAAVSFVESKGFRGPLYNTLEWGGYLIWRLPELPVSLDGRTDVHGETRVIRGVSTWGGSPYWRLDPELASSRLVIGPVGTPLMSLLQTDPRFELVFQNPQAMVYIARSKQEKQTDGPSKRDVAQAKAIR